MKMRTAEPLLLALGLTPGAVWIAARPRRVVGWKSGIARFETAIPIRPGTALLAPGKNAPVAFGSACRDSLALRDDSALAM